MEKNILQFFILFVKGNDDEHGNVGNVMMMVLEP